MIRTLRAFFLSRLFREKLLLVAFAVLGVLMWLSSYNGRFGAFWREQSATTATLAEQKQWIDNRKAIEEAEDKASASLDSSRTLNATQLYAEVDKLARDAGLTHTLGEQRNDPSGKHLLQVTATKVEWEALKKFYLSLQARSPYISVEQFTMRVTPPTHTATMRVSSVEISR